MYIYIYICIVCVYIYIYIYTHTPSKAVSLPTLLPGTGNLPEPTFADTTHWRLRKMKATNI